MIEGHWLSDGKRGIAKESTPFSLKSKSAVRLTALFDSSRVEKQPQCD
jgi:hypothetical protein